MDNGVNCRGTGNAVGGGAEGRSIGNDGCESASPPTRRRRALSTRSVTMSRGGEEHGVGVKSSGEGADGGEARNLFAAVGVCVR